MPLEWLVPHDAAQGRYVNPTNACQSFQPHPSTFAFNLAGSKVPNGTGSADQVATPTNYRKLRLYLYICIVYIYSILVLSTFVYLTRWLKCMALKGMQGHTYKLFSNRYIYIVANRQLIWKLLKLGVKRGLNEHGRQLANLAVDK